MITVGFRAPVPSATGAAPPLARSRFAAVVSSRRHSLSFVAHAASAASSASASEASSAAASPPGTKAARNFSSADARVASSSAADPGTRKVAAIVRHARSAAAHASEASTRSTSARAARTAATNWIVCSFTRPPPPSFMQSREKRRRISSSSRTPSTVSADAAVSSASSTAAAFAATKSSVARTSAGTGDVVRDDAADGVADARPPAPPRTQRPGTCSKARRVPSCDGRTFDLPSCSAHDHSPAPRNAQLGSSSASSAPAAVTTVLSSARVAPSRAITKPASTSAISGYVPSPPF